MGDSDSGGGAGDSSGVMPRTTEQRSPRSSRAISVTVRLPSDQLRGGTRGSDFHT